ncbi:MAG: hypothetical protein JWP52_3092, partial [Rhizobacter sp.]|nr:hypothetical protein [Rhizobacter sp.]
MPVNNLFIAFPLSAPSAVFPSGGQKPKPSARRDVTDHRSLIDDGEVSTVQTVTLDAADSEPLMAQSSANASCDFQNLSLTDIANGACAPPTSEPAPLQPAAPWFRLTAHPDPGLGEPFDAQHARMFAATREVSPDMPMAVWLGGPLLLAGLALTGGHDDAGTAGSAAATSLDEQENVPAASLLQGGSADDSLVLDDALLARLTTSMA